MCDNCDYPRTVCEYHECVLCGKCGHYCIFGPAINGDATCEDKLWAIFPRNDITDYFDLCIPCSVIIYQRREKVRQSILFWLHTYKLICKDLPKDIALVIAKMIFNAPLIEKGWSDGKLIGEWTNGDEVDVYPD